MPPLFGTFGKELMFVQDSGILLEKHVVQKKEKKMSKRISDWKTYARGALKGNFGTALLGVVAVGGANLLGGLLGGSLFQGDTLVSLILCQIFLFVFYLVLNLFSAGLCYLYLNMARGKEYSFGDLLYFFRHQPDRVIVTGFVLALIELASSIPYYYVNFAVDPGTTLESQSAWLLWSTGMLLLSAVLNTLLTLPFSQAFYLQADDESLGGIAALKESARIMKGKKRKLLLLMISFIPWMLVSVFTLYLALLWVFPYQKMAFAEFYRDLRGEFEIRLEEKEEDPIYTEKARDDYNAEA